MTNADRLTVIGIGATVVLAIIGGSCSTNARIDDLRTDMNARFADVNARIDDLRADMNARLTDVNARVGDLNAEVRAEHAEIRTESRRIDDRLRAVESVMESDQPTR